MSWNDPCSTCHEPRYACDCKVQPVKQKKKKIDKSGKFKVIEEVFFGGKCCIAENLSYKKAKIMAGPTYDVYTWRYILPNDISSDLIFDYDYRVD